VEAIAETADVVVVDSYVIAADDVSRLNELIPVVAVIDGDDRGIRAATYVDSNLGAESWPYPPHVAARLWGGSRYVLVRRELRDLHRGPPRTLPASPTVLCLMGGSDPTGAMPRVAASLGSLPERVELILVTARAWQDSVREAVGSRSNTSVVAPTPMLSDLLGRTDLVVSAAGTTAWDICTIGMPAVFIAIVANQRPGLNAIAAAGVASTIDASDDPGAIAAVSGLVDDLLADAALRAAYAARCSELFDGRGAERVADAMEELARERLPAAVD
jgi:spore coat polysaccharide biosynthesis predicted glycosyltransferase SpsG